MSAAIRMAIMCITLTVGFTAIASAASQGARWTVGEPIVTYWVGPGQHYPVNDQTVRPLRAAGYNLGWAAQPADLDVYHRNGIRALLVIGTPDVDVPEQKSKLDALIESVRNHPALYAYHLVDEPGSGAFPKLGKLVAYLRERDPAHLAYINLLPTYASDAQLQVSDDQAERARVGFPDNFLGVGTDDKTSLRYIEHVRQFVEKVRPDLISYDHYHFMQDGDGAQYFLNLALIRKAALDAKKPFVNIVQIDDSGIPGWRSPTEHEVRWLTYTTLAYGAQGISHWVYRGLMTGTLEEKTLKDPLPMYWAVAGLNRDFVAIACELQPLTSLAVYHCGKLPHGGESLPENSPFVPSPRAQELLLGYFGKTAAKPTHVMVVNLDYKNPVTTALLGPGPMEFFHAPTSKWHALPGGKQVKLDLPAGGGALVRLAGR